MGSLAEHEITREKCNDLIESINIRLDHLSESDLKVVKAMTTEMAYLHSESYREACIRPSSYRMEDGKMVAGD